MHCRTALLRTPGQDGPGRSRGLVIALAVCAIAAGSSGAQTPFEFALVRDLIQGEPFVSVVRIELDRAEDGSRVLELSVRGGLMPTASNHLLSYPAAMPAGVYWSGVTTFDLELPGDYIRRVFEVLMSSLAAFPSTSLDHLYLDMLGVDELSWISLRAPVPSIDSLLSGTLSEEDFWTGRVEVGPVDVGTFDVEVEIGRIDVSAFVPEIEPVVPDTIVEAPARAPAWRSLLLPGWGQISSGRPAGWACVAVEAAGLGLIAGGYYTEGGIALGVNHLVSFAGMLGF